VGCSESKKASAGLKKKVGGIRFLRPVVRHPKEENPGPAREFEKRGTEKR